MTMHRHQDGVALVPARMSLGEDLGDVAAHGLLASYRAHAPGGALPRHEHGASYLCIVLHGGYDQHAATDIECRRGSLIAHPAGHVHANAFGADPTRCINLYFDAEWLDDPELGALLADYRHLRVDARGETLARLEREFETRDAASRLSIAGAALDLIGQAIRKTGGTIAPRWLAAVRDAIVADSVELPSLAALAELARIHPAHLSRAFRRATGETIGSFARRLRLEAAERLLATADLSIAEIAAATGFYDQAHFARAYRRRFGLAPAARRAQILS